MTTEIERQSSKADNSARSVSARDVVSKRAIRVMCLGGFVLALHAPTSAIAQGKVIVLVDSAGVSSEVAPRCLFQSIDLKADPDGRDSILVRVRSDTALGKPANTPAELVVTLDGVETKVVKIGTGGDSVDLPKDALIARVISVSRRNARNPLCSAVPRPST